MSEQDEYEDFVAASQRHSEIMDDGDRIYQLVKNLIILFFVVLGLVIAGIMVGVK